MSPTTLNEYPDRVMICKISPISVDALAIFVRLISKSPYLINKPEFINGVSLGIVSRMVFPLLKNATSSALPFTITASNR